MACLPPQPSPSEECVAMGENAMIPAKLTMPLFGGHPRRHENPPSPPFDKRGVGGFKGVFLTERESRALFFLRLTAYWMPASAGMKNYDTVSGEAI